MGQLLFEDNAEFGYGMLLAQKAIRDGLKAKTYDSRKFLLRIIIFE